MGAKLLRNGHVNLFDYRINFFYTALEELGDSTQEIIRYNALSHRLSKLENKDFDKFYKADDKPKKAPLVVDHEATMRKLNGVR